MFNIVFNEHLYDWFKRYQFKAISIHFYIIELLIQMYRA